MAWGWGEEAARAFVGVAPVDIDIHSVGFCAATPLLDIPPKFQLAHGIFTEVLSRAHTLAAAGPGPDAGAGGYQAGIGDRALGY